MKVSLKKTSVPLVLASGSPYKKELLSRLQYEFTCQAADINEIILNNETPTLAASRLAEEKAQAIKQKLGTKSALIIGCDQIAFINDGNEKPFLGKPANKENALEQLKRSSGQKVSFYTAIHILHSTENYTFNYIDLTQVKYRDLDIKDIEDYLDRENALDCAGSAKIEGLGISLLEFVESKDPSALIGLPLIELDKQLRKFLVR